MRWLLFIIPFLLIGCVQETPSLACIEDACYALSVADTREERRIGFMHDDPAVDGILFMYEDSGIHCFWMKNTSMPLRILWLDEDGVVHHIEDGTPYEDRALCPKIPGRMVLELRSALHPAVGIGTKITFRS